MDEQELESVPRGAPHPLRSSTRCHTHSSHGEKTHARLIPAAPAHYFLAVILWIQVKVSRCLHSPKQLTSVSSSRLNIFGSILPFVPGQIWRQIGILQNNQRPACDECEASIVRYLLSNQLGIWGGGFYNLHAIIQVCNMDKYIKPFGQIHFVVSAVQSVGNLRRSLLARTRVCQMFPFTSYNPLGHRQSTNLNCHVNTFFTELGKCFIFLKPHAEIRKNS